MPSLLPTVLSSLLPTVAPSIEPTSRPPLGPTGALAPIAAALALVLPALGGEPAPAWNSFRGPHGTGVADGAGLPESLDKERDLLWRHELPVGYSSPVVAGDLVVVTSSADNHPFAVAIDRATGAERWRRPAPQPIDEAWRTPNSQASPTPATDGERIFVLYSHFGLVCYDLEGEEQWSKALAPFNVPHAMSSSPILARGMVIMQLDQDTDGQVLALDAATGAERWRVDRSDFAHAYTTPTVYLPSDESKAQLIVSGSLRICGYDLADGALLWWVQGSAWQTNSMPIVAGDTAYVSAAFAKASEFGAPSLPGTFDEVLAEKDANGDGFLARDEWPDPVMQQIWFIYDMDNDDLLGRNEWRMALARDRERGAFFAVRLDGRGDVTETHLDWSYDDRRGLPNFTSPLAYRGVIYLIKDGAVLTALDQESGAKLKQARAGESDGYFASPVAADGRILLASQSGMLSILQAGGEWEPLSVISLEEQIWATPALADGQVIVRTNDAVYCFGKGRG